VFELDIFRDSLEAGKIYRFRMRAKNDIGWGEYSADLLAVITAEPGKPTLPVRVDSLSSKTSIGFTWEKLADNFEFEKEGGRVLGYKVYQA